jgi:hypothetical protein
MGVKATVKTIILLAVAASFLCCYDELRAIHTIESVGNATVVQLRKCKTRSQVEDCLTRNAFAYSYSPMTRTFYASIQEKSLFRLENECYVITVSLDNNDRITVVEGEPMFTAP